MHIGPIIRAMSHNRTRVILVVLEIALTLAIVTNCVNVILAERAKMEKPSGFDDQNIAWLRLTPFAQEFRERPYLVTIVDQDLRAIEQIPGVEAAASTNFQLWEGGGSSTEVIGAGTTGTPQRTQIYYGTKDLVATLGARLVAGRAFQEGDHGIGAAEDPGDVAVISKSLADILFPNQSAVGKSLQSTNQDGQPSGDPVQIVGVIDHFFNPFGMPGGPSQAVEERVVLKPARVGSYSNGMRYLIRVDPGAMSKVLPEVEKRLAAVHGGRVFQSLTTPEKKGRWFSGSMIVVTTMSCIIVALIAVTFLGILGLTSLSVAERRRQIGTRRALGATRGDIVRHFLVENWLITSAGLALGIAGAYALNFLLVSNVSDVKLQWPLVAAGVVLLWVNGLISSILPAFRASLIPPSIATKSV